MPTGQSERAMDSGEDTLRGLGGREGRRPRHPPQGRRGTDEDDTARASAFHGGVHLPGDEQGSQGIDAPNSLKRLWRDLLDRTPGT